MYVYYTVGIMLLTFTFCGEMKKFNGEIQNICHTQEVPRRQILMIGKAFLLENTIPQPPPLFCSFCIPLESYVPVVGSYELAKHSTRFD